VSDLTWDGIFFAAALLAAIGSGLIAGVFYAFSTFVMRALAQRPPNEGMAAMQAINVAVINPLFLGAFLGTVGACALAAAGSMTRWEQPGAAYVLVGAALYLAGTFGVTIVCNVPLNNALASLAPTDPRAAKRWADYVTRWTMWNHVRTLAALVAMACFVLALRE
jgi:uncharacterized membrane protein